MSFFDYRDFLDGPMSLVRNGKLEISSFAQLFFDNLSSIVAILGTMMGQFGSYGFGVEEGLLFNIVYSKAAAGIGLSLIFGNFYYSWQASRMTRIKGRQFTAQPYGVSSVAAFAWIFGIMIPVYLSEWANRGFADDMKGEAFKACYNVAVAANFVVGLIIIGLGLVGPMIIKFVPPAPLLVPIAGIAFGFLGVGQATSNFSNPISGFLPLMFVFIGWFAKIRFFNFVPEAFTIIAIGTVLAWIDPLTRGYTGEDGYGLSVKVQTARRLISTFEPDPESFRQVGQGFGLLKNYMGTVIPIAITTAFLDLMCLLSARNAGDPFPIRETMITDGVGTCIASLFGSPFGVVVYIGHPAHKRSGATTGYSWLNGIVCFVFGMSGVFAIFEAVFPPQAINPIILFIGLIICEEAMRCLPQRYWPIFFFGLFPGVCDYLTNAVNLSPNSSSSDQWGIFSLKKGSMLISFFWCGILTYVVDRRWMHAAGWCVFSFTFAVFGIIHMDRASTDGMTSGTLGPYVPDMGDQPCKYSYSSSGGGPTAPSWPNDSRMCGAVQFRFAIGYLMMAVVSLLFGVAQNMGIGPGPVPVPKEEVDFQTDWDDVSHLPTVKYMDEEAPVTAVMGHVISPSTPLEEKPVELFNNTNNSSHNLPISNGPGLHFNPQFYHNAGGMWEGPPFSQHGNFSAPPIAPRAPPMMMFR